MLSSAAHLERLIHDLEYENTQMVKQIQNEEQEIEALEGQKKENTEEIKNLEKENSELDEMIKHFHTLFTRNRQGVENSRKTLEILREHDDALKRELQTYKHQAETDRKKRQGTLAKYQGILEEYLEVYESFDKAVELRKLQASNKETEMKLEELQKLYRQKCQTTNFKCTWVHQKNLIIDLATAWLKRKKKEKECNDDVEEEEVSVEQISNQSDHSDEQMEFHDAPEFPENDLKDKEECSRELGVPQGQSLDVHTIADDADSDAVMQDAGQPQQAAAIAVPVISSAESMACALTLSNATVTGQMYVTSPNATTQVTARNIVNSMQQMIVSAASTARQLPRSNYSPPRTPLLQSANAPQPFTAPVQSHLPNVPLSPSITLRPPTINLPIPQMRTPKILPQPTLPQVPGSPALFMPPMMSRTPLLSAAQNYSCKDSPLMPPPPVPALTQRRSPPKLLIPPSPDLRQREMVPMSPILSAPMVSTPSLPPPRSPKKVPSQSTLFPCTPSRPPRNEVPDPAITSTRDASIKPGNAANEIFQTPKKLARQEKPVFKTPPSHLASTSSMSKDSPFNFDRHRSVLQSLVTDSPGSDFRFSQKPMSKPDANPQTQEKSKSFFSAVDAPTGQGSPQVMSFLGTPWQGNFGSGDAATSEDSFNLQGLFGSTTDDSAKDTNAAEASSSFSFGGGSKETTGGENFMAMFGEGDNQDASDSFSFSFKNSSAESSPMSSAFKLF